MIADRFSGGGTSSLTRKQYSRLVLMEEAQSQALVQAQQLGPWKKGFKKIGTLLLMVEKLFFICSKRATRSKGQAMGASFFIIG